MKINGDQGEANDMRLKEFNVESVFIKHRQDYLLELITRRIVEADIKPSWLTITSIDSNENSFQSKIHIFNYYLSDYH
jgi:hypothetical protein